MTCLVEQGTFALRRQEKSLNERRSSFPYFAGS